VFESTGGAVSVFSNTQIRKAIEEGHIVCTPFNPKHIAHASLDVTLGYYYYRTGQAQRGFVYNPFDEADVKRYFSEVQQAVPHKDWCAANGVKLLENIPADHPVIPLRPGERILAHTHEFFGIKPPGAYQVKARSSWGRNGVSVCFDAGWVDPGYINRLTLEIFNLNEHETILLPVGERIAQAVFLETGPVEGSYGEGRDGGFSGKYQQGTDLSEISATWRPEMMLPRAFKDLRTMPEEIEGLKAR
jgi:deoxycytidine triphosphate deaminase